MVMQTLLGTKYMEMPATQLLRTPQKPGIAAMVMQTLLGTVKVNGNASNAAAAHTTNESLALLPWSCKLYSAPSIWKCQQCSYCAHHKSLALLP